MLQSGLISVTFRKLAPQEIIRLVSESGIHAIEWGGDIHVPHGDIRCAHTVGSWTRDAGIGVASYGSYYRVGCRHKETVAFERVLETAVALQAPSIRVWAGDRGSASVDEGGWNQVIEDARYIADMAKEVGITVDFEFHGGTLTDTVETTVKLLEELNHPNIRCHWQPQVNVDTDLRLHGLQRLLPWLANLHVASGLVNERVPLINSKVEWERYLSAASMTGRNHYALLEFVKDDDPAQFLRDAETLRGLIAGVFYED